MKKLVISLSLISLVLVSCKKNQCNIDYPADSNNGTNILHDENNILDAYEWYSLAANNSEKCEELKVVISKLSGECSSGCWSISLLNLYNWHVSAYNFDNDSQSFLALDEIMDLSIRFEAGEYKVELFEDGSSTPSDSRTIEFKVD